MSTIPSGLCVSLLAGATLLAQAGPSPRSLEITTETTNNGQAYRLTVRNTSEKNIYGYVLKVQYKNASTGENMGVRYHTIFKPAKNGVAQYFRPGDLLRDRKDHALPVDEAGRPAEYTVTVDSVVFEDGSSEGGAESRESAVLEGMIREQERAAKSAN